MSFLQPWVLWALPLVALPILIHLIHKRRHRVVAWGAMMFLLQGARMSRGMQKLRNFLLLLFRTLAVAGLLFALGRPLAGGWLGGVAGGRPDVVLVLLDRSASMRERVPGGTESKLTLGVQRLVEALERVDANRWACIDSVTETLTPLASPRDLLDLPRATETDAHADVPGMLEVAAAHLRTDGAGRAEIWILSDAQSADWAPEDGRWPALQDALLALPAGVRVNVLSFSDRADDGVGVRVLAARRVEQGDRAELVLDLELRAARPAEEARVVPVAVELDGARSVVEVELVGSRAELKGHPIPVEAAEGTAWGFVELPSDANPADDRAYFTFGGSLLQETVVVAEDVAIGDVLRFAAEAPVGDGLEFLARTIPHEEVATLDLAGSAALLWQGPLPRGDVAAEVERFLTEGGQVLFLPPKAPSDARFAGCAWGPARELGGGSAGAAPTSWRTEGDLLRDGADGTRLPVDRLEVRRLHAIDGDVTPLARFEDGGVLLARAPTERGGLYFLATDPSTAASNLANQGVVLVALVQRALEEAGRTLSERSRRDAGAFEPFGEAAMLSPVEPDWLLAEHLQHAGVVRDGERLVALNRPEVEDLSPTLPGERVRGLLPEVEVALVTGAREDDGLVDEVWRAFLYLMLFALVAEALLCTSEAAPPRAAASERTDGGAAATAPAPEPAPVSQGVGA